MSSYLTLASHNTGPLLQPRQMPTNTTAEHQGHKLLDQIAPSFSEIALKREDLKQVLKDSPADSTAIVGQIRNLQDFYRYGWQLCQHVLNKLGRG